ncbi:Na(+)/H(+) antiporter subunit B [Fodinicola acaciae]|uniref:Na(+)/H(+) antiporter subunit B n=1 Tax=Fodinicola acaciae TaxID=2681555 RepID=UPI0013D27F4A|nr:hydrogenase subunit MbhD domain-containing protein [Fodinicola acaciae]
MTFFLVFALLLVAAVATFVVLTRDPQGQAVTLSAYGLTLTLLFVLLQAPDVALSQLAVGAAVVPLMVLLAVRTVRRGGGER